MTEPPIAELDQLRVDSQPVNPGRARHADDRRRLLHTRVSAYQITIAWIPAPSPANNPPRTG